jgi:hypothetical protein
MAWWSRAIAEQAKSRVVKTAAVIVVEYIFMISFQVRLFSMKAGRKTLLTEIHTTRFPG